MKNTNKAIRCKSELDTYQVAKFFCLFTYRFHLILLCGILYWHVHDPILEVGYDPI